MLFSDLEQIHCVVGGGVVVVVVGGGGVLFGFGLALSFFHFCFVLLAF